MTYGPVAPAPSLVWPVKAPDAFLDFSYDGATDIGSTDTLTGISVAISPSGPGELVASLPSVAGTVCTVWLAGGVPGRSYLVKIDGTCASTRVYQWTIGVTVDPLTASYPLPDAIGRLWHSRFRRKRRAHSVSGSVSDTEKGGGGAFATWMRANWQWIFGCATFLCTAGTVLKVNTAANTAFELKLTAVEAGLKTGDERDAKAATTLTQAISDENKRVDSRMQEIFISLNSAIGEAAKHSDGREMEIFTSLNKDISDVAGRIDAQDRRMTELRHIRDTEQADMQQRIAVLESQLRFFADRFDVSSRPPVAPLPVPGKRR